MNSSYYREKRFLIVDYLKQSCELLQSFAYSLSSHHVDTSHCASSAVTKCENLDYDVILLGYDLGEGKRNGQQVLEQLRRDQLIKRDTVIIIITAEVSQEMVLACLEHKPDDYITKPYTINEVKQRLTKAFKKKIAMHDIYQAMDDQNHEKVISCCDQLLAKNTIYKMECLGIKSRQLYDLEQYQDAKEIYIKYVDNTKCQWAEIGLGKIALVTKEFEIAVSHFENVISKYPCYLPAYDWLAKTYQLQQDYLSAELTLELAVNVSPRSILRQKCYAELCLNNKHYDKSTEAFYKTYEIANNSIHHHPENILLFVKSLLLYANELPVKDIEKLSKKAIKALNRVNQDFGSTELKTQTKLLAARLYTKTNKTASSRELSQQAIKLLNKEDNHFSAQGIFDIIDSLHDLDITQQALPTLKQLAKAHPDNNKLHAEVNSLSETPIEQEDIIKARSALNIGIREYRNDNFIPAIRNLNQALKLFPNHAGIKLNLLQVLLVAYEKGQVQRADLNIAKGILDNIGKLKPNSEIELRFNILKSKHQKLVSSNSVQQEDSVE